MPGRHSDTGEGVADIGLVASMTAYNRLVSPSYDTLTFFQWTCDLIDAGTRLMLSNQQDYHR
ncbi:MAG TPA: hypothetical protein VFT57_13035 [Gemmatimonadaceae bacterium]|jgi:hypothetical protein|nr:hypothetical protein [Gemmatimonadaceae bacterium]